MQADRSRLSKATAFVRAHGAKTALEIGANFALPFAIYSMTRDDLGDVRALMAASVPPLIWSVVEFVRARKVDAIALLVLAGIALSLLAFAGGGGVKVLQLRENLVSALVGLVFLGSAAVGRPLMYYLARAGARRRAKDPAAIEALSNDPAYRRAMVVMTLVWAFGLIAVSAVNCTLVFLISIKLFLLVSGPISYGAIALLTAWTFWYAPRALRSTMARISAAGQPGR
jgi:hypothetical protein